MITERPPWHQGEILMQQRVGVAERMARSGRTAIRDHLPEQHRAFYRQLPFLLLGTVDAAGDVWASVLEGRPGFAHSRDPRVLRIDVRPAATDPAAQNLHDGDAVGLLGIELSTRRRNRINGRAVLNSAAGFSIAVEHAFGNCPQYIQLREPSFARDPAAPSAPGLPDAEILAHLDATAQATIRAADTCFVASYVDPDGHRAARQVDISHRGGKSGFVKVDEDCLTIPDFAGNLYFNTLGNFVINPRAGLLFIDFATGDVLQVTGVVEIVFDGPEVAAFQGAERLWRVRVTRAVRRSGALALRGTFRGFSPNSLLTGSWEQATLRRQASALGDVWRPYRVMRIEPESSAIASFYLEPDDQVGRPIFRAGQHLPLRVRLSPDSPPLIRTYSLSSAPSDDFLRISVKRDGAVSSFLHERVQVGDLLEARAPQGEFVIDAAARRPLVLLAAGVGVTPLLSMLRHVVYEGQRTRQMRRTFLVYSARSAAERPFSREIAELVERAEGQLIVTRALSVPEASAREGVDYEHHGRIDVELLKELLPFDDYDFVLCGPGTFTQALYDGLRALRVSDDRIHAEQFGPSTLRREMGPPGRAPRPPLSPAATEPVQVRFARAAKEALWAPGSGTLLELAEASGLTPEFSCRGGSCGTCRTRIVSGMATYLSPPPALPMAGEVLICCAVPAAGEGGLVLDL